MAAPLIVVSDIHGKLDLLDRILKQNPERMHLGLGDVGVGFPGVTLPEYENFCFTPGNHDGPEAAKRHPSCVGYYGFLKDYNVFFCGGAESVDRHLRIEGLSWWSDEQISEAEGLKCLELYKQIKPSRVVTHDAPGCLVHTLIANDPKSRNGTNRWGDLPWSRTQLLLQKMFDIYEPDQWIFGHFHIHYERKIGKTKFICLKELETYQI